MRALAYIYEKLVELEPMITDVEQARLLHRAIEACKYNKQPEFDDRFGLGNGKEHNVDDE